jgi:VanZ family protein
LTVPRWAPPLVWAAAILVATSIPQPRFPDVPGIDKVGHLGMYAVLAVLIVRALVTSMHPVRTFLLVLGVTSVFGAADEWHQQFIPGRTTDPHDWLADTFGAGFGTMISVAAYRRRERESQ